MNSSGKRIPAGWSFVGGTLLGALAAVALPASIHMGGARAGSAGQAAVVAVSEVRTVSDASVQVDQGAVAEQQEHRLAGHSELELQPD
jgi:hypothetical protein